MFESLNGTLIVALLPQKLTFLLPSFPIGRIPSNGAVSVLDS